MTEQPSDAAPPIDLAPAAAVMTEVLADLVEGDLTRPTPCGDYTVGDLVDHVDQIALASVALAEGDDAALSAAGSITPDATHLAPSWQPRVIERVGRIGPAWNRPGVWERPPLPSGGGMANAVWGRIWLTELVVHAWDLAAATTGRTIDPPRPTLEACWDHVSTFLPSAPLPALWGPPVEPPRDAALLDEIVAMTGRDPQHPIP